MTPQHPRQRPQRRMTNINITEVSGVTDPAHLIEGWVIAKAADKAAGADLPAGAFSLKEHEAHLVSSHLEGIKNGEEVDFRASGKGARLGKTASGEPYLTTPASIARAVGEEWARTHNVGQRPA